MIAFNRETADILSLFDFSLLSNSPTYNNINMSSTTDCTK